jgi:hypothetical protein
MQSALSLGVEPVNSEFCIEADRTSEHWKILL